MKSYSNYKKEEWADFKERIVHLKASIDPQYLIKSLGFDNIKESPKEIRCSCIIHGGDNETAFRFNKDTGTWVCFTNKCHEQYGNDVIGLVKAVTGRDFMQAIEFLKQFAPDLDNVDYMKIKRKREMDSFIRSYNNVKIKPKSVNEKSLLSFRSLGYDYFLNQGFSKETLDFFEVGNGWQDKNGNIRSVIPIRDERSELVAYSLRDNRSNASKDFKYILTSGFNKDGCLYNLNNIQTISTKLPIIVVEGFKGVWRLRDYGIKNVVATMGSGLTEGQIFLLCMYALSGVVLLFDNDKAGVVGTESAYEKLKDKVDVRPVFIQEVGSDGKGLDPSDLTKKQIYEYLNTYY